MIAFFVPLEVGEQIQRSGSTALGSEDLHITLAYLGEAGEIQGVERLPLVVQKWAESKGPVQGRINGVGRFCHTSDDEGRDALVYLYDSPELGSFRDSLVQELLKAGFQVKGDHGFIPHITLDYIQKDQSLDISEQRITKELPIEFTEIHVRIAGQGVRYPLGSKQEVIKNQGGEIVLQSEDGGQVLGRFAYGPGEEYKNAATARAAAVEREKQIQFFKHQDEALEGLNVEGLQRAIRVRARSALLSRLGQKWANEVVNNG